ncbi:hypothetical protein [Planctomicrobium sp. SH527]|uniref:hypothetical protein n=1 Tax=Planctomicrobium sp. SH527 TaxID=3448123 RepID=UPI003F5AFB5D
MTISQVAERIGLKLVTVSQWERFHGAAPASDRIGQLCEAMNSPEFEMELLELAHHERGKIAISLDGLDEQSVKALTAIEKLTREGNLTAAITTEILKLAQ